MIVRDAEASIMNAKNEVRITIVGEECARTVLVLTLEDWSYMLSRPGAVRPVRVEGEEE